MIIVKYLLPFAISALLLSACGTNPNSYINGKSDPIVNIEAPIAQLVNVEAKNEYINIQNNSPKPLELAYTLVWYDANGVGQTWRNDPITSPWEKLPLAVSQTHKIELRRPNNESVNYRFYLRAPR
ncbi:YcfL family protein [[Haemophilus] ducreyi]|uniref:YcfL family protein n=1 Tax=Haemophilus ducreyi TaxID=730 RepID=UPI00065580EE|nr:YcfL family protein [[Haemophilus] ducreyi]AKO45354.1 hypothetical protein RZ66_03565 [[Haemophilus] ducreyi]AKO46739.1 hypothetical protein RZ67_03450 [[Haemophilus] ducreyi]AKO48079.1 hypothetical protein RZ68_03445 [[Haemophilus] ducreyi]AKO50198.1 hypothetical protein RZ69_03480 [[Haemophilus] ducreyi]OOS03959.1 hypothetical protein B0190_03565 [[Haemophilus] ducreyi]